MEEIRRRYLVLRTEYIQTLNQVNEKSVDLKIEHLTESFDFCSLDFFFINVNK